ncbi:GNAT family N-acetyltransferase [Actinopolyspora mortivallis]|uniref:GNAT family N-acetyltransferase n=1 Tax=Actinopolyspora mortivallis TaxID=33906 RepID=A0A2T0H1R5_ACTMO|nr:GNAT family N-acetyltransferase [Actinopolyspora mortivallis]PRW65315.1 GNAT family N-acetyltransferase [Actinopolyspora mortivallis]
MTEHDVRCLPESEFRASNDLFREAVHAPVATEEAWRVISSRYEPGRVWGDYLDGELAGTAMSLASSLTVPGGAELPAAAVTAVGVRADRTRRGVLTALMRAQLTRVRDRGETAAMLHASETGIYGRFGYGVATTSRTVALETARARPREDAPGGGRVRLLGPEEAGKLLPAIYRTVDSPGAGMISRPEGWWTLHLNREHTHGHRVRVAVHSDEHGTDDGFAVWVPGANDYRFGDGRTTLRVLDLHGADAAATAALWWFLLGVDLADEVVAVERPPDEPLEWWLADSRQCRIRDVYDELWVRPVDVAELLRRCRYDPAEPVVLGVRDRMLPENTGCYRITPDGAERSQLPPQLEMDVSRLAPLLFGEVRASTLAEANLIEVSDPDAVSRADRLFATRRRSWCGTHF